MTCYILRFASPWGIEIYAHNTADSTEAFLLALKSKGYRPRVIVTDLRREYGSAIKSVFKGARHHECIFHALQWWGRKMKEIYCASRPLGGWS